MVDEKGKLRIAFIHPDLGIGGAERLVVDAAIGLQEKGHEVVIYTSHCDKTHCFEEVKKGLLKVEVFGDEIPTNFAGRFFIVFANLRQLFLVSQLILTRRMKTHDLFIVDQLSTCLPFLHMFSDAKSLFYCHFPDQLLAIRSSLIKKLYRIPFDVIEQFTMSAADSIVVNSNFTRSVYERTFRYLKERPSVIYPCVDLSFQATSYQDQTFLDCIMGPNGIFYLSINRFERKKNIKLALESFAMSKESNKTHTKLVICGGYDERVQENVQYLKELQKTASTLQLSFCTIFYPDIENVKQLEVLDAQKKKVIFITSISSSLKELLLEKTELLMYTPSFEHFGIVPLEAMKHGKPVLAVNTGGPLETVEPLVVGKNETFATGWLRKADAKEWSNALDEYRKLTDKKEVHFRESGPKRVRRLFSRDAMTQSFMENISTFIDVDKKHFLWETLMGAVFNLLLQYVTGRLFISSPWPYLLFALVSVFIFKSFRFSFYWSTVFAASWLL